MIFGCDISIASLNVLCQPIYYPATGEDKRLSNIDRLQRMMGHEKRIREGSKGDAFSSTRFKFKFAKSTHNGNTTIYILTPSTKVTNAPIYRLLIPAPLLLLHLSVFLLLDSIDAVYNINGETLLFPSILDHVNPDQTVVDKSGFSFLACDR